MMNLVRHTRFTLALAPLALHAPSIGGQTTATMEPEVARAIEFPLTIQSIMRGSEIVGQSPQGIRWTDDSRWIYFRWLPGGAEWHATRELYRVSAEGGEPERLDEEASDAAAVLIARGDLSPDRRSRVSSVDGDLYLVDRRDMSVRRLTETVDPERSPRFSGDGSRIFFLSDDNLFSISLDGGDLQQLSDIRKGPRPPEEEKEAEGQEGFLEQQQEELFEHIRVQILREERREADRERGEARRIRPVYVAKEEDVQNVAPDPTGRHAVLVASRSAEGATQTMVPVWVTESGYTEERSVRTKVGDETGSTRLGLFQIGGEEVTWLDLTRPEDPAGEEESTDDEAETSSPELAMARFAGWNDSGSHGLIFAVDFDYKEWRLYAVEAATGELTMLDSLEDEAWVAGPCFGFCIGWIPGTDRAYYVSEETGYAHLYTVEADGSDRRQLTAGEWEVLRVSIPEDRSRFELHTSEVSPFDQHFYTMELDGSDRTQVTRGAGRFNVTPSPDGVRLAILRDRANRPAELFVAARGEGLEAADMEQVTVSPTAEWLTFPWIEPEIVRFRAQDGTRIPARIYRPADLGVEANGAGVIFVHGAGYLHNVHNWWSSYYREYMFHHFLAANGYTVLDIDYRASAGYGRDWRTATYRWMGGLDLSDQVDGARYLVSSESVDPGRIGLYGGSYGGFITLMALFTEPETFEAGAALRSVTDWAHYNQGYTSRILNLPYEDEAAYRRSSPIYFAEGLEGHLLIAHGMVDTNVQFSDVVRLAQRLIELGKENWEMAVYPVENHGFVEPTSWTDEYRRIYELFDRTIGAGGGVASAGEG